MVLGQLTVYTLGRYKFQMNIKGKSNIKNTL